MILVTLCTSSDALRASGVVRGPGTATVLRLGYFRALQLKLRKKALDLAHRINPVATACSSYTSLLKMPTEPKCWR